MRHDPLFVLWTVHCATPEDSRKVQQWLQREISAETTLVDEVRSRPDGVEVCRQESYRLGDYFESVRVVPSPCQHPSHFGLLFQRRPDAGRFWKDFMVKL